MLFSLQPLTIRVLKTQYEYVNHSERSSSSSKLFYSPFSCCILALANLFAFDSFDRH